MYRSAKWLLWGVLVVALAGCRGIRPPASVEPVDRVMLATGYCKCGKCCGWRRTWYGRPVYASGPQEGQRKRIGMTASGTMAKVGTIAADSQYYPFGTTMYVEGYGYGRVEDRGGAIKGQHIDLFFPSHRQAEEWGSRRVRVRIWSVPQDP